MGGLKEGDGREEGQKEKGDEVETKRRRREEGKDGFGVLSIFLRYLKFYLSCSGRSHSVWCFHLGGL